MGTNQNLSNNRFERQLAFGQIAETEICRWLMRRGGVILPVYDIEYETGKGPRVFNVTQEFIAPDLLIFRSGKLSWIEAKHKTVFSWYRKKQIWETGIDRHHYRQYQKVQAITGTPVWLMFLHVSSTPDAKDRKHESCPPECPTGLFGDALDVLVKKVSHEDHRWGKHGMVYWAHQSLRQLATLDEVRNNGSTAA